MPQSTMLADLIDRVTTGDPWHGANLTGTDDNRDVPPVLDSDQIQPTIAVHVRQV